MESIRKRSCIRNAAKRCIEDKMAAVCNKSLAPRHPQYNRTGKAELFSRRADRDFGCAQAELVDFDRQWKTAKRLDHLRLVGNDDHALGSGGNDLLAQQRAA